MNIFNTYDMLRIMSTTSPQVYALIRGGSVTGNFAAYPYQGGSIVLVEVRGLPATGCGQGIHAMHIHEGSSCTGTPEDPFANAGGHFSTTNCPHPYHTGDLPPLFSTNGNAWNIFYTTKFTPEEVAGRTVIIHEQLDDLSSQPAGNSGAKIACGEIFELYS